MWHLRSWPHAKTAFWRNSPSERIITSLADNETGTEQKLVGEKRKSPGNHLWTLKLNERTIGIHDIVNVDLWLI